MAESGEAASGKARKRSSVRVGAMRQAGSKVKCTIHLTVEASQRLDIHATMMALDRSALVEKLIHEHLRRYIVSDRGGSDVAAGDDAAA